MSKQVDEIVTKDDLRSLIRDTQRACGGAVSVDTMLIMEAIRRMTNGIWRIEQRLKEGEPL